MALSVHSRWTRLRWRLRRYVAGSPRPVIYTTRGGRYTDYGQGRCIDDQSYFEWSRDYNPMAAIDPGPSMRDRWGREYRP